MAKSWIGRMDWYDYGARYYDAAIERWHAVDPMVEMYYSESPYVYCVNNFVSKVDPIGCFRQNLEPGCINCLMVEAKF
jgi:cell well associated rhsD protein